MNVTPNTIALASILEKIANMNPPAGNPNGVVAALNTQNTLTRSTVDKKDSTPTMSNPNPMQPTRLNNFSYTGVKPLHNPGKGGTMTNMIANPIKTPNFLGQPY